MQGELNTVSKQRDDTGGKGLNVSSVLHNFGMKTTAFGFAYNGLPSLPFPSAMTKIDSPIRINYKLIDEAKGEMTEVNTQNEAVTDGDIQLLLKTVQANAHTFDVLILTGSVPPNSGTDIYKRIMQVVRKTAPNTKIIVDSSGEQLRNALEAKPDIIKPNLYELETTFNVKLQGINEIIGFIRGELLSRTQAVFVTMGADGAIAVNADEAYLSKAPKVQVRGLAGAGDSFCAGVCMNIGNPLGEVLRQSMAIATGSVILPGTQLCTPKEAEAYLPMIEVCKIK
jgi:1-phosphofructokinase